MAFTDDSYYNRVLRQCQGCGGGVWEDPDEQIPACFKCTVKYTSWWSSEDGDDQGWM